jgi:hypothetical protein
LTPENGAVLYAKEEVKSQLPSNIKLSTEERQKVTTMMQRMI